MDLTKKPLRVGFDLDGVLLYNPLRLGRPIIFGFKSLLKKSQRHTFFIPQSPLSRSLWRVLHYFGIFVVPGFDRIQKMVDEGIIEAYIITARYSFLQKDFEKFLTKTHARAFMKDCIYNSKDEQPHLYKERIIRELQLDMYVEDNWNIVDHLSRTVPDTKILWMYNSFDRNIIYPHKFAYFTKALQFIRDTWKKTTY